MNRTIKTHIKGRFFFEVVHIDRGFTGNQRCIAVRFGIKDANTGEKLAATETTLTLSEGQGVTVDGIEARQPAELTVSGGITAEGVRMLWAEELDWLEAGGDK